VGLRDTWNVAKATIDEFVEDDATTLAAALAYYPALGLSPMFVLLIWLATFAGEDMQQRVAGQLQGLVGPQGGQALKAVVDNADSTPQLGTIAGIVSLATLLFSVSGVFGQLQAALNRMWDVKAAPTTAHGNWIWVRKRLLSLGAFLSVGFMLIVSLAVTAFVEAWTARLRQGLPGTALAWELVTFGVSLLVSALLFALIFKVLPDVKLGWRDTAVGGFATAILFSIGRWAIGVYIGRGSVGSAYGAAGSLIAVLVWVYYASLVMFLGAELTQVLARRRGKQVEPEAHAICVERHEEEKPNPEAARA
jgi:membrane protein